jgi:hypothetical protein
MPFDPNVPQAGQTLDANVVRNQFNALNDQLVAAAAAKGSRLRDASVGRAVLSPPCAQADDPRGAVGHRAPPATWRGR